MNIVTKWPVFLVFLGWLPEAYAYNSHALWLAAFRGELNNVQAELDAGADANSMHITTGQTALMVAALYGHFEVVEALLRSGCNWNARDLKGYNALILATYSDNLKVVQELIRAKVPVNIKTTDGRTALSEACAFNCSKEILEELIKAGADVKELSAKARFDLVLKITSSEQTKSKPSLLSKSLKEKLATIGFAYVR